MGFCTKCGKPLQSGEICICQQAAPVQQVPPVQQVAPVQQVPPVQQVAQRTIFTDMKDLIVGVFKTPVETATKYVESADMAIASILIVVYSLILGLSNLLFYATSSYDYSAKIVVNGFFEDFVGTIVAAVLFSLFIWAVLQYVFRLKASFIQCLCIFSLKAIPLIPAKIIYRIFTFLHIGFISEMGSWFTAFASAFAAILVFFGVRALCKKENSIPMALGIAAIGTSFATYIVGLVF